MQLQKHTQLNYKLKQKPVDAQIQGKLGFANKHLKVAPFSIFILELYRSLNKMKQVINAWE